MLIMMWLDAPKHECRFMWYLPIMQRACQSAILWLAGGGSSDAHTLHAIGVAAPTKVQLQIYAAINQVSKHLVANWQTE